MRAYRHEDTIDAGNIGYPEEVLGAQTLEFLFGKAFMKKLCLASVLVSKKPHVSKKQFLTKCL
jgi:hypothetical protein